MAFRVELTPTAARQLRRLSDVQALALRGVILALGADPRPSGSRKIAGSNLWRLRVRIDGVPWRVVYQVRAKDDVVVIARVARRDAATYRRLNR